MISELRCQMDQRALEIEQFRQQLERGEMRFWEIRRTEENNRVKLYHLDMELLYLRRSLGGSER